MIENQCKVVITADHLLVILIDDKKVKLQRISLPEAFMRWQSEARLKVFDQLKKMGARAILAQPSHLPVLASIGKGRFPINLVTRGIGLLPKPTDLEQYIKFFEEVKAKADDYPWPETLPTRVDVIRAFYSTIEHFDPWMLGGLEIFGGKTADNLQRYPFASIIYTGEAPNFPSYQFNGVVVFISNESPYYRFLLAARELFAFDAFHIPQIRYPHGYLFYVTEVLDKTPYPQR